MNEIQRSISPIIKGYTIYLITSIAAIFAYTAVVISIIYETAKSQINPDSLSKITSITDLVNLTGSTDQALVSQMLIILILTIVVVAVSIYAMFKIYKGFKAFGPKLDAVGAAAVNNLSLAMLISIISSFVAFVPLIGGLMAIAASITAFVFTFMGYSALRGSASLNEEGKIAAKKLFQSIIFYLIMIGCFITIIGIIAVPVFIILYWVYLFNGLKELRDSFATKGCKVPNALSDHQAN